MRNDAVASVQMQTPSGDWVKVGLLHNVENRNWFEFDDNYWGLNPRPVLGQVFEENGPAWKPSARVALPRWFGHLLPEGRVREAVARAAETSGKNEFDLLVRLGESDLPGAIRVTPDVETKERLMPDLEAGDEGGEPSDPILKFSLAGAQLKFSVYGDEKGITVPAKGTAGNLIVKFPDGRPGFDGVPEAELGALALASAVGINAPHAFLIEPASILGLEDWAKRARGKALAIARFDRADRDRRIHMEELAQIVDIPTINPDAKYRNATTDTVATVLAGLTGVYSVGEIIDRIVLNVLVGNGDAHLKNWAVVYDEGRLPKISPVYDVVPTVLYMPNDDLGLKLNKSRAFQSVTTRSFESIGRRTEFGASAARRQAADAVVRIMDKFKIMSEYLTKDSYDMLQRHVSTLNITRIT